MNKVRGSSIRGRDHGRATPVFEPESLDPVLLLQRLGDVQERLESGTVEIYHRVAISVRVALRPGSDTTVRTVGREEGTAVRVRDDSPGSGFATASGGGERTAEHLVCVATGHARPGRAGDSWAEGGAPRVDHDEGAHALPPVPEVEEWLAAATERIRDSASGVQVDEAWVETASTCESLAGPAGLRASRLRRRHWALVLPRERSGRAGPPVIVAGRRWPPDMVLFCNALEDRRGPVGDHVAPPRDGGPLLVAPEPAATLVLALVRALYLGREAPPPAGGPGWSLVDDPGSRDALFGGSHDDAGFPTRRRRIAGPRGTPETIDGPGTYRRPSYREEPRPMPSRLAIDAPAMDAPDRGVLVTSLRVHPMGADWVLEIEGSVLDQGRPVRRIRPAVVRTDPADLVRRCTGAIGPIRESFRGVATPALVFDALTVR